MFIEQHIFVNGYIGVRNIFIWMIPVILTGIDFRVIGTLASALPLDSALYSNGSHFWNTQFLFGLRLSPLFNIVLLFFKIIVYLYSSMSYFCVCVCVCVCVYVCVCVCVCVFLFIIDFFFFSTFDSGECCVHFLYCRTPLWWRKRSTV